MRPSFRIEGERFLMRRASRAGRGEGALPDVWPGCKIEGERCSIRPNCRIEGERCPMKPDCRIEQERCLISLVVERGGGGGVA